MTTIERIIETSKSRKIPISRMERDLGFSNGYLGKLKKVPDERLNLIADYLNVSVDYLLGNEDKKIIPMQTQAQSIASRIEKLDATGRGAILALLDYEESRLTVKMKEIPLYGQSFAAGSGEPDYGNTMESYEVPEDSQAEVAFRVHGDSLEPYYMDGDIVLGVRRFPKVGEIAALVVDGEYKIKQVCRDDYGNVYLLALNRKREDTDQTLWRTEEHSVYCLGTILTTKRIPMP